MSGILGHLKKHKKKYLTGLATAALAAGTGVGIHHHIKKKNETEAKLLRNSRLMSHAIGMSSALTPHLISAGQDLAAHKGAGYSLKDRQLLNRVGRSFWHGNDVYQHNQTGQMSAVPRGTNVTNSNYQKIAEQPGVKHSLYRQSKIELGKAAINKLSDIMINKMHGDKWNSNKHSLQKMTISNYIGNILNVASAARNIGSQLFNAYERGRQQRQSQQRQ